MNTTHKVSIGGMAFVVDDEAYSALRDYTDKLHTKFGHRPDGQEIVNDVEARIAELLSNKILTSEQLVSFADVKDVLERIGDPSEMDEGEDRGGDKANDRYDSNSYSAPASRRLFRSADDRVIGGVCGGLGAYLHTDPVFIRVAFVVLTLIGSIAFFGGIFPIVYIVLWISTPTAYTVAQKLEMEGKKASRSNIEDRIRREANNMTPYIQSTGSSLLRVFGMIVKAFAIFFISIFVLVGVIVSCALLLSIFGVSSAFLSHLIFVGDSDWAVISLMFNYFPNAFWFKIALLLLAIIPTALLILLIIKAFVKSRLKFRYIIAPLIFVWFVALFSALISGASIARTSFGSNNSVTNTIVAPAPIDTLTIKYLGDLSLKENDVILSLENDDYDNVNFDVDINGSRYYNHRQNIHWGFFSFDAENIEGSDKVNKNSTIFIRPLIRIEYDDAISTPRVVVKKWATGRNFATATNNAESIDYEAKFVGKDLMISPAIPLKFGEGILKGVEVNIMLPSKTAYDIDKQLLSSTTIQNSTRKNGVYIHSSSTGCSSIETTDVDTVIVR